MFRLGSLHWKLYRLLRKATMQVLENETCDPSSIFYQNIGSPVSTTPAHCCRMLEVKGNQNHPKSVFHTSCVRSLVWFAGQQNAKSQVTTGHPVTTPTPPVGHWAPCLATFQPWNNRKQVVWWYISLPKNSKKKPSWVLCHYLTTGQHMATCTHLFT